MVSAAALCEGVVHRTESARVRRERRLDRLLTGRALGYPLMLVLLALIFFLTIRGANILSAGLSAVFSSPLARCRETAAALGFEPVTVSELFEMDPPETGGELYRYNQKEYTGY